MSLSSATDASRRWWYCMCPLAHGAMAPSAKAAVGVGHHQLRVDLELGAEAVAALAGAVGRVEREVPGGELVVALAVDRAGQVLREGQPLGLALAVLGHQLDLGHAVGEAQRRLERIGEAAVDAFAQHQPVDHDLDGVVLVAGQLEVLHRQVVQLAVDAGTGVALGGQVCQQGVVVALAAPHHRGEHLEATALGQLEHPVDDLLGRLAGDDHPVLGAVRARRCGRTAAAGTARSR
jgi:hypothetical protein